MENLTKNTFDNYIATGKVLIDVWADWCGPCKSMIPVLEQLDADQVDLKIGKVDAGEELKLAQSLGVRNIPAFILYQDGKIVDRKTGACDLDSLKDFVN